MPKVKKDPIQVESGGARNWLARNWKFQALGWGLKQGPDTGKPHKERGPGKQTPRPLDQKEEKTPKNCHRATEASLIPALPASLIGAS